MNKEMELIGVDQKVYALGRHEPFRDAESLKTIYFRCHGTDRDTHVELFGQPVRPARRTKCALAGFRDDASLKFQPPWSAL